ncbi:MAG: hypothetical protein AAFX06_10910 [Planctomycetota bacterium]
MTSNQFTPSTGGELNREFDPEPVDEVSLENYEGWQTFELIPPSFRNARDAKSVLTAWMIVTTFLIAFLLGSLVALFFRGQAMRQRNLRLVADATPLDHLQKTIVLIEQQNETIRQWSSTVETAKPDDSVLQILASVAHATHPDSDAAPEDHLDVQSLHVKLALEHSGPPNKTPNWAQPRFSLSALANTRSSVTQWSGRLSGIDRLAELEMKAPTSFFRQTLVQANAVPRATSVVP